MELKGTEHSKGEDMFPEDFMLINLDLKHLADAFSSDSMISSNVDSDSESDAKHDKEEMFLEDQPKAACAVSEAPLHQGIEAVPGDEVRTPLERREFDLKALKDKEEKIYQVKSQYRQILQHSKKQVLYTEMEIRAVFNKLYLFLKEEEDSRLAALMEEKEQKSQTMMKEMKKIQEKMSSLQGSTVAVEEELRMDTVLAFINSYKDSRRRVREQYCSSELQLVPGALIDVAKHLGNLAFSVWQKMKNHVHFRPVILDPNTGKCNLDTLWCDLNGIGMKGELQQKPLLSNPERGKKYITVLGSEGFSSGQHSWEVEVKDWATWAIGVAKESAGKNNGVMTTLIPEEGYWCLVNKWHPNKALSNGYAETVEVKKSLERVGVQLDFDRGEVSFYDAVNMSHIYTYIDVFTEKVLPYFSLAATHGPESPGISICEQDFSVMFGKDAEQ